MTAGGGPDGTVDSDDPKYFFVYDDQWRVIATYRKEDGQAIDSNPKEWFVYHAAGLDGYGGSSYIDATVLRDRDFNTDGAAASDGTLEQRRYYCQNWRADVVAVLSEAGVQDERVAYSAYGVPFGMPAGDTDADGDFDTNDQGAIAFWEMMGTYDVRGDVDLDGSVTSADAAAATTESLGWEALSGIDSRKGYAGYEHAPELAGTSYHVRYRVLKADLGRWLTRDPEGYSDGMSLYGYVQGLALVAADPMGLCGMGAGCGVNPPEGCDWEDWGPSEHLPPHRPTPPSRIPTPPHYPYPWDPADKPDMINPYTPPEKLCRLQASQAAYAARMKTRGGRRIYSDACIEEARQAAFSCCKQATTLMMPSCKSVFSKTLDECTARKKDPIAPRPTPPKVELPDGTPLPRINPRTGEPMDCFAMCDLLAAMHAHLCGGSSKCQALVRAAMIRCKACCIGSPPTTNPNDWSGCALHFTIGPGGGAPPGGGTPPGRGGGGTAWD